MGVTTDKKNKPFNPRGNDQSPLAFNRAKLYSGKALDFDGVNDVVNVTTSDLDFGANDFSVSAIVKWEGSFSDGKLAYAETGSSGSMAASWQIRTDNDGNLVFQAYSAGWQGVTFENVSNHLTDLVYLTFVRVGTGVSLYINGVFFSNGDGSLHATLQTPNGAFAIGNRIGASNYWNGLVSNFKVFSGALTAAQVADLYNNPEKVVPTGVNNTALKLWLPMQEGAGTTAYDGSGNGNHGAVSGATYVNGVGAPVAQTSVIDWNKGVNVITYSEDLTQWDTLVSGTGSVNVTANYAEAPNGTQTADRLQASSGDGYGLKSVSAATSVTGDYVVGIWAKSNTGSNQNVAIYGRNNVSNVVVVTTEWTQIQKPSSGTSNFINVGAIAASDANVDVLLWGGQMEQDTTTLGPYIPTIATAQTSEVLLPQGLTTGRDITGVNLFENVRKQGALNLDGNSWGKIHPNNSFAFGTGAFSMEAWAKLEYVNTGSYANEIIALNDSDSWAIRTFLTGVSFTASTGVSLSHTITLNNSWAHIVGLRNADGSMKLYINGVEEESNAAGSSTASVPVTNPVRLGTDANEASRTYKDQIAQPRIYNRALTAAEVLQNYNSGKNTYK